MTRLFTVAATQAISNSRRWQHSRNHTHNLEIALDSRAEIDQAKGVLMAIHGYDADDTFATLVGQSQQRNVKLKQVARELLHKVKKPGP